ncbi:hypothetical protein M0765_000715 [Variovorax sp. S2]|uniref:hypothetical protein n=1 Tax=Variovorax sp. S12S4 TaxID=3029170 RepID=UPI00215B7F6E|nr:hypothetical protein [Variovorax sp. S12S4]MCR8956301.1 hypothetical protein [Variovorax sp. S12S4]
MSGIRTSQPVALIRGGNGLDIDTFADELHCVLQLVNTGSLGRGVDPKAIGWGSAAHKQALQRVAEKVKTVIEDIAEQDRRDLLSQQGGAE